MGTFLLGLFAWFLLSCLVGLVLGPLLADPNDIRPQ